MPEFFSRHIFFCAGLLFIITGKLFAPEIVLPETFSAPKTKNICFACLLEDGRPVERAAKLPAAERRDPVEEILDRNAAADPCRERSRSGRPTGPIGLRLIAPAYAPTNLAMDAATPYRG